MIKDYYSILQIASNATPGEIKTAYRRLAMTYHPDKTSDPYDQAKFNEIKEAYEVLTNPLKKDMYLQERWYHQSLGKKRTAETTTPVSILRLVLELEKHVSTLDAHRMSQPGLSNYVSELLSLDTIEKLKNFDERDINRQIITTILMATRPLKLKIVRPLLKSLRILAGDDQDALRKINKSLTDHKRIHLWDKYKVVLMLLFTILICLLIYFTSK